MGIFKDYGAKKGLTITTFIFVGVLSISQLMQNTSLDCHRNYQCGYNIGILTIFLFLAAYFSFTLLNDNTMAYKRWFIFTSFWVPLIMYFTYVNLFDNNGYNGGTINWYTVGIPALYATCSYLLIFFLRRLNRTAHKKTTSIFEALKRFSLFFIPLVAVICAVMPANSSGGFIPSPGASGTFLLLGIFLYPVIFILILVYKIFVIISRYMYKSFYKI